MYPLRKNQSARIHIANIISLSQKTQALAPLVQVQNNVMLNTNISLKSVTFLVAPRFRKACIYCTEVQEFTKVCD
jgi:hypothetical protein